MTRDAVTPALRDAVLLRDGGCMAPILDMNEVGACRTRWGYRCSRVVTPALTLDHIQSGYGRMGKRAPSDMGHLVTLCWHHHLDGWATAHRPELREYLRVVA